MTALGLYTAEMAYRPIDVPVGYNCLRLGGRSARQQGIGDEPSGDESQQEKDNNSHRYLPRLREGQAAISVPAISTNPPIHNQMTMGLISTWNAANPSASRLASTR